MNNDEFYQQLPEHPRDVEQSKLIIVREAKLDEIQTEEISITDILSYGMLTSLALIGTIVFLKLLKTGRHGLEKIADPVRYFSQVPCRKCRFFSSNPYLKCTVHPSIVLKTQAKDCSDYWPINGKFPS
jgi:hypothetical protein